MFVSPNGYRARIVWIWQGQTPLAFCLWGCTKCEVYKKKVDTRDELLARILVAAAGMNKRENQRRRATRDLRTRVATCTEVDGGIFEPLLWTVRDLLFLCNKSVFQTLNYIKIIIIINIMWFLFLYYRLQCFLFADSKISVGISVTIQNDTCPYQLFFSQWRIPRTPKILTLPPESPGISDLSQIIVTSCDTGQVLHTATFSGQCLHF
jgi:hypothetical protein